MIISYVASYFPLVLDVETAIIVNKIVIDISSVILTGSMMIMLLDVEVK